MPCLTFPASILTLSQKLLVTKNTPRKFVLWWLILWLGLLVNNNRSCLCATELLWRINVLIRVSSISRIYIMLIRTNSISRRNQYPGRRCERDNARFGPRDLPICHLKFLFHWRRLHRPWLASLRRGRRFRRRQGVLYASWRRPFSYRTGKRGKSTVYRSEAVLSQDS